jgi:benzoyl-CoA reductase/2-hydroxyglutaryl-CoA dehydratase subunit BcrC/BadD/HgdB
VKFLGAQLNKVADVVKEVLGVELTAESWDKVADVSRRFFHSLGQLTQLMMADPTPISTVATGLALNLIGGCTGRAMTEGPAAIDILAEEAKQRVDKGIGIVEKGTPRVLIGINNFVDPRITHMMEEAGISPVATAYTTPPKFATRKALSGTYTTQGEARAERELRDGRYHSSYAPVARGPEELMALNPDGVIASYLFNCRPSAIRSHQHKLVADKTGIPHLSLEVDIYDSRNYSAEALRTRVETFAAMLRARKAAK